MTIFIGDIHCEKQYLNPDFFERNSIQVGDLCLKPYHKYARYSQPRYFICGNHDYYPELKENWHKPYEVTKYGVKTNLFHIPRGFVDNGVLFIGGGYSIDNYLRMEGIDWWQFREQLTYAQLDRIGQISEKINIVVSHDCPESCYDLLGNKSPYIQNGHSRSLQNIFEKFSPNLWIHGHHHISLKYKHNGCEFISLGIGQKIEINDIKLDFMSNEEFRKP